MNPAEGTSRPTVLVVDDDADIREALEITLTDRGYDVRVAENGAVALRLLRDTAPTPDVVLLDLMMPVMDGAAFREAQLRDPRIAGVPVVVLSGHGQVARKAAALGVDDFCEKPVDIEDLLELLGRFASPAQ
jgi:CheY-like chemotaxis protein